MPEGGSVSAAPPAADHGLLFPIALAATAGFADAFGYLTLHGLLTAHVTGNLAFMAVGLARGNPHIIMKFLALPLFMAGVSLATVFITWIGPRSRFTLAWCLLLEAVLLLLCLLAGCCVGTILIMSMATQNAIMRLPLKKLPSTTAMTTNVTEATVLLGFGRKLSPEDKQSLFGGAKRLGLAVAAFALGGIMGGVAGVRVGYGGLIAPIGVLACLALCAVFIQRNQEPAHGYDGETADRIK
jgi:uncharacterized membrane protein YoaK (UPF0700 family)